MSRRRWTVLIAIATVLVILPVACIVALVAYDWNRAKPWLETRASRSLGREIAIGGDVDLLWRWRRRIDGTDTFSPGFALTAEDVRIGNPDWATRKRFAELGSLDMDVRLFALFLHHLDVPAVRLVHPKIDLEQRKDGANTWTFAPEGANEASAWKVEVGEIAFDEGEVAITDETRALDVRATITRLESPIPFGQRVEGDDPSSRREVIQRVGREAAQRLRKAAEERAERRAERGRKAPPPYVFAFKASGKLDGERVTGEGRMGGVFALENPRPFPVRADIDFGATSIALTGTITDPASPDAIDMRLWISGPNLAKLYAITGVALPNTPQYATVGRLAGRFRPGRSVLRYEDFTARVGGSDLSGTLTYRSGGDRPTLSGDVDSSLLQFRDLGTLIGAAPAEEAKTGRLLPDTPFDVEHWKAMDADVHFTGKRVVRTAELPISNVDTKVRMQSGVLSLDPLRFDMAGGNVQSSIRIDANAALPKGVISIDGRHLKLHRLFENVGGLKQSPGEISGTIKLTGAGKSIAALLGRSDGSLHVLTTGGRVSETLMEEAGLNFANVLIAKMKGDQMIDVDCAAAQLTVANGVAKSDLFVFDTENAIVVIDGTIDLGDERVDLTLHPETKNVRIFSLRSPLHVTGNFEHLDVSVDKKSLFARGAGAIALGIVATPLAALVPLTAPGGSEETRSCAPLVEELGKKAPLPAQKKASKKPAKA